MSFSDHKIQTFTHKISDLPDQPNMQPEELKAHFDSSPEELRQALNALCDALAAQTAAADIGFAQTAGVPETTVQEAIENVQAQVTEAIIGSIPSGSVTQDKLAQDVRDRLTAIESAAASEASIRQSTDSSLQSQVSALSLGKSEVIVGTYTGDGQPVRLISLGRKPKAVYVCSYNGLIQMGSGLYGGLALQNAPAGEIGYPSVSIVDQGFQVYYTVASQSIIMSNSENVRCYYIAWL